mmetsp:Transcript_6290/g.18049  ORF Transcript_6290/g.18049 Transcript_6290/m.18049 type:complete len:87 (-) Transcript_6290:1997-2257(-)
MPRRLLLATKADAETIAEQRSASQVRLFWQLSKILLMARCESSSVIGFHGLFYHLLHLDAAMMTARSRQWQRPVPAPDAESPRRPC